MPFVSMCPYCRVGGIRVPDHAVGASATCPACKTNYTVFREEPLPGRAERVTETAAHPTAEDVTEPSPVLTEDRPLPPLPRLAQPTPLPAPPAPAVDDPALAAGLAGLILFGLGVGATQLPYGRAVGLGLCLLGGVVGLAALGGGTKARLAGAAAGVLNAVAALVLLFAPAWLGLLPWRESGDDRPAAPQAVGHGTGITAPAEWVGADTAAWQSGDVRVSLRSAVVGAVESVGPGGKRQKSREEFLQLTVRVTNEGADRRIALSGWAAGSDAAGVRLTDPAGRAVKGRSPEPGREPPPGLFPGKSAEVVLLFEPPAARSDFYRLELPGAAVGAAESVRFHVPGGIVTRRRGG